MRQIGEGLAWRRYGPRRRLAMRQTFLKLGMVVALGVCTSLVTSVLINLSRSTKAGQLPPQSPKAKAEAKVLVREGIRPPVQNAPPNNRLALKTLATFMLRDISISTNGPVVKVSAGLSFFDARPNIFYVWSLHAYTEDKMVVFERFYDKQIFGPPPNGEQANPTFDDAFELAPGKYSVVLSLYEISPRFGLANLKDKNAERQRVWSGGQDITVAP